LNLRERIRTIPDFPVAGIRFRDITPLLADGAALAQAVREMAEPWRGRVDVIAAIEARGFILGGALAVELEAGFVPVRKAGKLPTATISVKYTLEYRSDSLQVHEDSIRPGERVLIVDDLIATGGTARAVLELVERLDGRVQGAAFLIELEDLGGRELLGGIEVHSLIGYNGD
jgi:adenine phosphoribosyltransferase